MLLTTFTHWNGVLRIITAVPIYPSSGFVQLKNFPNNVPGSHCCLKSRIQNMLERVAYELNFLAYDNLKVLSRF